MLFSHQRGSFPCICNDITTFYSLVEGNLCNMLILVEAICLQYFRRSSDFIIISSRNFRNILNTVDNTTLRMSIWFFFSPNHNCQWKKRRIKVSNLIKRALHFLTLTGSGLRMALRERERDREKELSFSTHVKPRGSRAAFPSSPTIGSVELPTLFCDIRVWLVGSLDQRCLAGVRKSGGARVSWCLASTFTSLSSELYWSLTWFRWFLSPLLSLSLLLPWGRVLRCTSSRCTPSGAA